MGIKKRGKTTVNKSHKKVGGGRKQSVETKTVTEMAKMVFSVDHYEDEDAVRSQIDKMEWEAEGFDITTDGDGNFVARPEGMSDDDYTSIGKVALDDDDDDDMEGIEAYIGKREVEVKDDDASTADDDDDAEGKGDDDNTVLASDDEDDEDDDDAVTGEDEASTEEKGKGKKKPGYKSTAKSSTAQPKKVSKRSDFIKARKAQRQPERKFDAWDARFSKGNTLAKTLKDGMEWDGLPPGYYEVQAAFSAAVGNIIADDGLGDGKQEALNKTAMDYAEVIGGLDSFFDAYIEADEETVAKVADTDDKREALAKWVDAYAEVVENEGAQPETSTKSVADAIDYNEISEGVANTVAALIAKSVDPLREQVEKVSGTVESIASRRPTKKAADPEEIGDGRSKGTKDADPADDAMKRFGKSFLG